MLLITRIFKTSRSYVAENTLHSQYKTNVGLFLFNNNISALQHYVLPPTHGLILHSPVVTIRTNRFNIQQFYVLPTQCIYVFCVDLRTNSDYFPIQH